MPQRPPNPNVSNKSATLSATQFLEVGRVLPAPAQRQSIVIVNTSTNGEIVYISIGQEATQNNGVALYPGGVFAEAIDSAFIPSNDRYTVIASAATATIAYQERVVNNYWSM